MNKRIYKFVKVICIKEYYEFNIGDTLIVKDYIINSHSYLNNSRVYPKSHFIPLSEHRKKQISKIINYGK